MESLYDGFDVSDASGIQNDSGFSIADDDSPMMSGTAYNMSDVVRPMTSNKSAGYSSLSRKKKSANAMRHKNSRHKKGAHKSDEKQDSDTQSMKAEKLEKNVNRLLKESIFHSAAGNFDEALDLAQKCRKKESEVIAFRDKFGLEEGINADLTFSVLFNLGHILELKGSHSEALTLYNSILSGANNKGVEVSCRLRVNIGNIYYAQQHFDKAMKMYRMALDEIGDINAKLKMLIQRNIGNALIKMGEFVDAIQSFEGVVEGKGSPSTIFNLLIAYYTLGDKEKMKKCFLSLLACSLSIPRDEHGEDGPADEYSIYLKTKWLQLSKFIKQSVQLIGRAIADSSDDFSGFDWLIQHLYQMKQQQSEQQSASAAKERMLNAVILTVMVQKGIEYLRDGRFASAIAIFSELADFKDANNNLVHHNNLAFISFLKCEYAESNKLAASAVSSDRYNASALVNRANCLYVFGELEAAKEMYLEAIGVEADCVEAIYNLGLICKAMGNYNDALQAFKKLNKSNCRDPQILYQIGSLFAALNEHSAAIKWFKVLHSVVPCDAVLLAEIASLYKQSDVEDDQSVFQHYSDSYKVCKVNLNIISWLGIWFINNSLYESAIAVFRDAARIQPTQIKWRLMIASCFRRMRSFQKAIAIYRNILETEAGKDAEIAQKCLQYLVVICKQIGDPEMDRYQRALDDLILQTQQSRGVEEPRQDVAAPPSAPSHHQQQQQSERHRQEQQRREEEEAEEEDDNNWADVQLDDELLPS